jgi:hypothetical protein
MAIVAWYNLTHKNADVRKWLTFFKYFMGFFCLWSVPVTGLFIVGGIRDLVRLFKGLKQESVDAADDGQLHH